MGTRERDLAGEASRMRFEGVEEWIISRELDWECARRAVRAKLRRQGEKREPTEDEIEAEFVRI